VKIRAENKQVFLIQIRFQHRSNPFAYFGIGSADYYRDNAIARFKCIMQKRELNFQTMFFFVNVRIGSKDFRIILHKHFTKSSIYTFISIRHYEVTFTINACLIKIFIMRWAYEENPLIVSFAVNLVESGCSYFRKI